MAALGTRAHSCSIVRALAAMGHSLSMREVAAGVESAEQADLLRHLACDERQGWLIARPMPADRVPGFIHAFTPRLPLRAAGQTLPSGSAGPARPPTGWRTASARPILPAGHAGPPVSEPGHGSCMARLSSVCGTGGWRRGDRPVLAP